MKKKNAVKVEPPGLALLAYVERPSTGAALADATALIEMIEPLAQVVRCEVKPYWKVPEYQGIDLNIELSETPPHFLFDALKSKLAATWHENLPEEDFHDRSAVWDHRNHAPVSLPSLRWMHLQYWQGRGN